jgi:hypothetical protein
VLLPLSGEVGVGAAVPVPVPVPQAVGVALGVGVGLALLLKAALPVTQALAPWGSSGVGEAEGAPALAPVGVGVAAPLWLPPKALAAGATCMGVLEKMAPEGASEGLAPLAKEGAGDAPRDAPSAAAAEAVAVLQEEGASAPLQHGLSVAAPTAAPLLLLPLPLLLLLPVLLARPGATLACCCAGALGL